MLAHKEVMTAVGTPGGAGGVGGEGLFGGERGEVWGFFGRSGVCRVAG